MTKNRKTKLWVAAIIVLSNTFPMRGCIIFLERDAGVYCYSFSRDNGIEDCCENWKDGTDDFRYFELLKDTAYVKEHPRILTDTVYRHFKINPLFFWHWWDYFFDERYTLPYMSREDVVKNRERKQHPEILPRN